MNCQIRWFTINVTMLKGWDARVWIIAQPTFAWNWKCVCRGATHVNCSVQYCCLEYSGPHGQDYSSTQWSTVSIINKYESPFFTLAWPFILPVYLLPVLYLRVSHGCYCGAFVTHEALGMRFWLPNRSRIPPISCIDIILFSGPAY